MPGSSLQADHDSQRARFGSPRSAAPTLRMRALNSPLRHGRCGLTLPQTRTHTALYAGFASPRTRTHTAFISYTGISYTETRRALGLPVVPLVYMMVHRSAAVAGRAGDGAARPASTSCCHARTVTPNAATACAPRRAAHYSARPAETRACAQVADPPPARLAQAAHEADPACCQLCTKWKASPLARMAHAGRHGCRSRTTGLQAPLAGQATVAAPGSWDAV